MTSLFIALQHILPQHLLSRLAGKLAELQRPRWLKNWVIRRFVAHYGVDLSEAEKPFAEAYACFNEFFTRSLVDGSRPQAIADLLCPADGAVSQVGTITGSRIYQAKGRSFSTLELLAGDRERAAWFDNGEFATIYLSPRDYHRVHMPAAGRLIATCYVPGSLFSVNTATAAGVDRLFARNERLVCYFDGPRGPYAMVLVGAMIVAGIETVWAGRVAPPPRRAQTIDYRHPPAPVALGKGDEMGRFYLGSTVILLFPSRTVAWNADIVAGAPTRVGAALAHYVPSEPTM